MIHKSMFTATEVDRIIRIDRQRRPESLADQCGPPNVAVWSDPIQETANRAREDRAIAADRRRAVDVGFELRLPFHTAAG